MDLLYVLKENFKNLLFWNLNLLLTSYCKFETLLVKIFNLNTKKQNQILPEKSNTCGVKIKFLLHKKTVYGSFR